MTPSFIPEAAALGTAVDIHAGFPNAAADTPGNPLSLDRLLITRRTALIFSESGGAIGEHWAYLMVI